MEKGKYITTPIYYVNDIPHIGHAYTTVAADVIARYNRMCGQDVLFLTGTDEHGQKVQEAAARQGREPSDYVDEMVVRFRELWTALNITNDDFIRTTEERHIKVVQGALDSLYSKGEIYLDSYEGWYCLPDERFWMEKDLAAGQCPECGRSVEKIAESNYFFRMSKYQDWLIEYIKSHPDYIQPGIRRNEVLGFLQKPLGDLCISRPKSRLSWGIPLPFDNEYVTYVWFDALINYVSIPGYLTDTDRFNRWWPADFHLIGKDILTTHSVYWSAMLKAMNIEPPKTIFAHGWWTIEGEKMSKSRSNVVDPFEVIREFGVDPFRYFLLREVTFGLDGDFSRKAMVHRINSDLANDLGNLLSRTVSMIWKYFDGTAPAPSQTAESQDTTIRAYSDGLFDQVKSSMDRLEYNKALSAIWKLISSANRYIDESAPWVLARDDAKRDRLAAVIYNTAEALRVIALYIYPYMPETAEEIWRQLGIEEGITTVTLDKACRWGGLRPGSRMKKGKALFPRIEVETPMNLRLTKGHKDPSSPGGEGKGEGGFSGEKAEDIIKQAAEVKSKPAGLTPGLPADMITIDDFAKVRLRVGKIISAETVKGSKKLIRLQVDMGDEKRQVVAGIAAHYSPEDILGKSVVIVSNLKPARLMGLESQGMLLAAGDGEALSLIGPDKEIGPGSPVK